MQDKWVITSSQGKFYIKQTPGTLIFKPTSFDNMILSLDQELAAKTQMCYRLDKLEFGSLNNSFDFPISHKSKNI